MADTALALPESSAADEPFDDTSLADIVIRTSDNFEFFLMKGVLIIASPFFRDMFSISQPAKEAISMELERIPISESRDIFDPLMRFCYPVKDPVIANIALLEKVLEAAMKYQLLVAIDILKTSLRNSITDIPLYVYAVACRLELEEEAHMAAAQWKPLAMLHSFHDTFTESFATSIAGGSYTAGMATITSGAYYRLVEYVRGKNITSFIAAPLATIFSAPPFEPAFSRNVVDADVILLSSDNIRFPVHATVLRVAGAGSLLSHTPQHNSSGPAEIQLEIVSSTLNALIELCYPFSSFKPTMLRQARAVFDAATKYNIPSVATAVKHLVLGFTNTHPLSVYLIASIKGWTDEATSAARKAAVCGISGEYVPEMEEAPATAYYRLLEFHHRTSVAIYAAVKKVVPECGDEWQSYSATDRKTYMPPFISAPVVEKAIQDMKQVLQEHSSSPSSGSVKGRKNRGTRLYCHNCEIYFDPGYTRCNCGVSPPLTVSRMDSINIPALLAKSRELDMELATTPSKLSLAKN